MFSNLLSSLGGTIGSGVKSGAGYLGEGLGMLGSEVKDISGALGDFIGETGGAFKSGLKEGFTGVAPTPEGTPPGSIGGGAIGGGGALMQENKPAASTDTKKRGALESPSIEEQAKAIQDKVDAWKKEYEGEEEKGGSSLPSLKISTPNPQGYNTPASANNTLTSTPSQVYKRSNYQPRRPF